MTSNCFMQNYSPITGGGVATDTLRTSSSSSSAVATTCQSSSGLLYNPFEPTYELHKPYNLCQDIVDISRDNFPADDVDTDTIISPYIVTQKTADNYYGNSINSFMKNQSMDMCRKFDVHQSQWISQTKLDKLCHELVQRLNYQGICVFDNFMDNIVAGCLQNEVQQLYKSTDFQYGMLSNNNLIRNIRGDLIYWITGNESNCYHIHGLIKTIDLIVFKCNKLANNGLMGVYNIKSRTPAMVACYPGNGSRFMKHADNYSGDGRCITCIYYVNREWQYLRDGGCLRVYPNQISGNHPYMDIEPVSDRLVLFWSDRRNLHEVMPSNRFRFAITVWYLDEEERRQYKQTNKQL
ncbi:prolyl hydroxylase EGLN3-like [Oppia nitens]|uniref:prolyl hydroxylase EGLN3-like n=1 Tax=Oppia nitens TaxID=1686743 RepID=UPI0023DC422C|nr:prolyl hydroxylase EGLN3-like [Oppia nitens]